jgi:uncharacterized protein (DUF2267 family)
MRYETLIDRVKDLDFVDRRGLADALLKAVLGIMASSLSAPAAQKLTQTLPEPLNYAKLRDAPDRRDRGSVEQCFRQVTRQFNLSRNEAERAVNTVLKAAKRGMNTDLRQRILRDLPQDWRDLIGAA